MTDTLTHVERIAVGTTYRRFAKQIRFICDNAHRKFGGDIDDLMSEASELFITNFQKYDESKGSFESWIYHKIRFGLMDLSRSRLRRARRREKDIDLDLVIESGRWDWFSELDEETQLMVKTILRMDRPSLRSIRCLFADHNWSAEEIERCFNAIREGLKSI